MGIVLHLLFRTAAQITSNLLCASFWGLGHADGSVQANYSIPVTRESLTQFAELSLSCEDRLALEATTNTWAVTDVLRPHVGQIVISNPLRTRAIAEAKIKTDKIDARVLAELLRADYLPSVWQPGPDTQRLRRLTHRRSALVSDRTRLKNRLHSILHHCLIPLPKSDLFSKQGRAWLQSLSLPAPEAAARDSDLRLLQQVEQEIAQMEESLTREAWQDDKVRLLMSIPGIDYTVAQTCLAAIGDVTRFKNAKKLTSYLGLNPSTHQSGPHCVYGHITKQGNAHARWLLVQAAQHMSAYRGPIGQSMRTLIRRKNRKVAVVACARKLAVLIWHVLSSGEPFRYAVPKTLEAKYARLRVRATGARRKGGIAKGAPRPQQYGHGRTKAVPSLSQVLEQNGLPGPAQLSPGETTMLAVKRLEGFYSELHTPTRVKKS